jgi:hypothetical protein
MTITKFVSVVAIATLLSHHSFAQAPAVDGIGIFKIGKTYDEIMPAAEKQMGKVKKAKNAYDGMGKPGIWEEPNGPTDCADERRFSVSEYKVADITLRNVHIIFYKNVFISFTSEGGYTLSQALKDKYGAGQDKTTVTQFTCTTSLGSSFELPETDITTSWGDEKGVYMWLSFYDTHDSKTCEAGKSTLFAYYDTKLKEEARLCSLSATNNQSKKDEEEKKKKRSDF